jgi:hypothetical protein
MGNKYTKCCKRPEVTLRDFSEAKTVINKNYQCACCGKVWTEFEQKKA